MTGVEESCKIEHPMLHDGAETFETARWARWKCAATTYRIVSVEKKRFPHVDAKVFARACNWVNTEVYGVEAQSDIDELKTLLAPAFLLDDGKEGLGALIPLPTESSCSPVCVEVLSKAACVHKHCYWAILIDGVVTLLVIEFDKAVTKETNMCGAEKLTELFYLLQHHSVITVKEGSYRP